MTVDPACSSSRLTALQHRTQVVELTRRQLFHHPGAGPLLASPTLTGQVPLALDPSCEKLEFHVHNGVGRLIATSIGRVNHPRQVGQIAHAMFDAFQRCPGQAVICTDWRPIRVFAPEVADAVIEMLSTTNKRLLRGAILLAPDNATLGLQVERLLHAANNPVRKTFRASDKMLSWLAEVLTPAELECAKKFLLTSSSR